LTRGAKTSEEAELSTSLRILEVEEVLPSNNGVKDSDSSEDKGDNELNEAITSRAETLVFACVGTWEYRYNIGLIANFSDNRYC